MSNLENQPGKQSMCMQIPQQKTNKIKQLAFVAGRTINLVGQTLANKIGVPVTVAVKSEACVANGLHHMLLH